MRVYLKCDKNYNGDFNVVDGGDVWIRTLEDVILNFVEEDKNGNPIINITEEVVDFYNEETNSCKSAQSIAKNLRRRSVQIYADRVFKNRYCSECGMILSNTYDDTLRCTCGMLFTLDGDIIREDLYE